ncbi:acyl-CoA/acyl-ACP dehydrogenase [Sphingobium sufflavum]|uniref:acyl-CoA dehydrogenase family protein n=1 Tax=Sphingobium sufflavum TaxID=1129547 RepID=UPI001F329AD1|nr:acyl-CoA dehydrogenase family protein [Sphingobium sufflavum]MCE7797536.1 acyl-CoA/acyl-ACP dehydrogenase [Sphingobium sufflavum]
MSDDSIGRAELQDAARKAFGEGGLGQDPATIWDLIVEMGWLGMTVPEELGGLGLGAEAQGVIHFELGRILAPGPVAAHMMVIEALVKAGRQDLIERAVAGELMTGSLRFATATEAGGTLSGTLNAVPDADTASELLVVTDSRVLLLPIGTNGITLTERPLWDKSRRLFDVTLSGVSADAGVELAGSNTASDLVAALKAHLLFALSADSLGGAEAALDMSVEYLKTRRQFDRPLAMFQALKHRAADMKTILASAEALLWTHASEGRTAPVTQPVKAGALKAHAARVYHAITEEAVQFHGGIGLTEEHQCHLYLKRATLNEALGGGADLWEEQAGRQIAAALLATA